MSTGIYTKTVTGTQWTGDNADELIELMGPDRFEDHGECGNPDDPEATASFRDDHRGGSWYPLLTGDWVLRDDAGDWHSCSDEQFAATYTRAEQDEEDDDAAPDVHCTVCQGVIRCTEGDWWHDIDLQDLDHDASPPDDDQP